MMETGFVEVHELHFLLIPQSPHRPHLITLHEHRMQRGVLPPRTGSYKGAHICKNSPACTLRSIHSLYVSRSQDKKLKSEIPTLVSRHVSNVTFPEEPSSPPLGMSPHLLTWLLTLPPFRHSSWPQHETMQRERVPNTAPRRQSQDTGLLDPLYYAEAYKKYLIITYCRIYYRLSGTLTHTEGHESSRSVSSHPLEGLCDPTNITSSLSSWVRSICQSCNENIIRKY